MFYIGVITYNRKNTLKRTIESIIPQMSDNDRVIIVDDGSTDGTREFIYSEYKDYLLSGHVVYSFHENGGINFSRHEAVEVAKNLKYSTEQKDSSYFLFCDSDDWLNPNALAIIDRQIKDYPKYGIYAFPWMDDSGKPISINKKNGWYSYDAITSGRLMEGPDFHMIFDLDMIGDIQFQKDLRWGDGYFFEELVAKHGLVLSLDSTYTACIKNTSTTRKWQDIGTLRDLYESEVRRQKYVSQLPLQVQSLSLLKLAVYGGVVGKKLFAIQCLIRATKLGIGYNDIWLFFAIIGILPFSLLFYNIGNYLYQKRRII